MRRSLKSSIAVVLCVGIASLAAATARAASSPVDTAMVLLDQLEAGHFDAAEATFDASMRQAVPVERLTGVWKSLPPAQGRGAPQTHAVPGATIVAVPLHRAGMELVAQVVVGDTGGIKGFLVQPAPPPCRPDIGSPY